MRSWRRGMTLVEVCVAVAILLGVLLVLTSGVVQVFGASQADTLALREQAQRQRLEIRALREGRVAGRWETATIEGEVEIEPTIAEWFGVGLAYDASLEGHFVARGEGSALWVEVPPSVLAGWREGSVDGVPVEPDENGLLVVPPDVDVRLRWRELDVGALEVELPSGLASQVRLSVSEGLPVAWDREGEVWTRTGWGPVELFVDPASTRYGWVRDLGLLGAAGMLLFGVGFVYVNEGERPGSLDEVHLGGALLLALDYALFFALLLVLVLATELPVPPVVVISTMVTTPLLGLHLIHLTGRDFALRRALPWALVTWAIAVLWIASPSGRILLALGVGVGVLAFTTSTYAVYGARRDRHAREEAERCRQQLRDTEMEAARSQMRRVLAVQPSRMDHAEETLKLLPVGHGAERGRVARALDHLELWMTRASGLLHVPRALATDEEVAAWVSALQRAVDQVQNAAAEVDGSLVALEDAVEAAQAQTEGAVHCLACGAEHPVGSRFCTGCGSPRPPELGCACGTTTLLPPHLLAQAWSDHPLHCGCCGRALRDHGAIHTSMS